MRNKRSGLHARRWPEKASKCAPSLRLCVVLTDALGWMSSLLLLFTLGKQVQKQWQSGTSKGVSKYLFLGQMAASAGFTAYSWRLGNAVFVVTNALALISAIFGYVIFLRNRKRDRRQEA